MSPELVVLGNLIVDDIVYDTGATRMRQPGGATLYMGLAAGLWDLEVGLVSVAGADFPRPWLQHLADRGVDLTGVRRSTTNGLRTWLLYEGDLRRVVHRLDGATHDQASPTAAEIPDAWQPRAVHLAPMPFHLHMEQVADVRTRFPTSLISVDPFELLREETVSTWRSLLAKVDLFFISEDEVPSSRMRLDPEASMGPLLADRLRAILYKQGREGGRVLRPDPQPGLRWPGRAAEVVDTTGAGDAFACGVMAGLIRDQTLKRALEWGVVSASFAIEGQGPEGLLAASASDARDRLTAWFGR